ncbi:hypothetical protein CLFO_43260 [Clostridium formicaceticum]|uniref:Uncharacterized protein n=2 Tax=Clostridium formicaceticum TaxID=1497 RepID=A0AAC9RS92_9CLOT|nr:hypothetical protein BJL90_05415 [Clostridium formicaceticum]ARE89843.1 hypothetical protein CLFO_43260 [Clostridium formicaceticum]
MTFTCLEVGQPCPPIIKNIERYRRFSGAKLEVHDNGNYLLLVFLDGMTNKEVEALRSSKITFKTIEERETGFLLTLVGISSRLQFEIIFDPTLYKGARGQIAALEKSNLITLVGIDTRNMNVRALRVITPPKRLRTKWLSSWNSMINMKDCSRLYVQWINSLYRYTLDELWNMAAYEGKGGE